MSGAAHGARLGPPVVPPVRLIAETFEATAGGGWQLVVRHEFYGATEAEAHAVYRAHLSADAFLRGCFSPAGYRGIVCRTDLHVER